MNRAELFNGDAIDDALQSIRTLIAHSDRRLEQSFGAYGRVDAEFDRVMRRNMRAVANLTHNFSTVGRPSEQRVENFANDVREQFQILLDHIQSSVAAQTLSPLHSAIAIHTASVIQYQQRRITNTITSNRLRIDAMPAEAAANVSLMAADWFRHMEMAAKIGMAWLGAAITEVPAPAPARAAKAVSYLRLVVDNTQPATPQIR